ncbi:MAG: YwbE family protein [Candidatus Eremiobacterota bacterium]
MNPPSRSQIRPGLKVAIVTKADQPTGRRTVGVVAALLTRSPAHPHGIKVRLQDGQVGRVQEILE